MHVGNILSKIGVYFLVFWRPIRGLLTHLPLVLYICVDGQMSQLYISGVCILPSSDIPSVMSLLWF